MSSRVKDACSSCRFVLVQHSLAEAAMGVASSVARCYHTSLLTITFVVLLQQISAVVAISGEQQSQ
jgi:hypothetical protein